MRFYLICIFLSGLSFPTFSNNGPTAADSLFTAGNYFEAAIAFEKSAYFSTHFVEKNRFRIQKALCYKAMGDYASAKKELNRVNPVGLTKSENQDLLYETVLLSYLDEDYEKCSQTLLLINFDGFEPNKQKNLYLLASLNFIMTKDFEKSEHYAIKYALLGVPPEDTLSITKQIHHFYLRKNLPKLKNEKVFEWISIVPGMGQMYVGEVGEGLTNIALNLTAFSFGVIQFINGFYITGYFVGTLSINKFYFGGRTRAKHMFDENNASRLAQYNRLIKDQLIQLSP